jgi:hypothetical protein
MIMGVVDKLLAERARQNNPPVRVAMAGPSAVPVPVFHRHAKHRAKSRFGGRFGAIAIGAGVALLCTEQSGMVIESSWLRRWSRYRTPVMLLLRALLPTATSVAVARLLFGHHVVVIVTAAAVAYLVTRIAVGQSPGRHWPGYAGSRHRVNYEMGISEAPGPPCCPRPAPFGITPSDWLQRSKRNVRRTSCTSRHKGIRLASSPPTAWRTNTRAADGAADRRIGSPQLPGHDRLCGTIRSIDLAEPAALPTST